MSGYIGNGSFPIYKRSEQDPIKRFFKVKVTFDFIAACPDPVDGEGVSCYEWRKQIYEKLDRVISAMPDVYNSPGCEIEIGREVVFKELGEK